MSNEGEMVWRKKAEEDAVSVVDNRVSVSFLAGRCGLVDGVERAHDLVSKCSIERQTTSDAMVSSDSARADVSREGALLL